MGKTTGFMEIARVENPYRNAAARLLDFEDLHVPPALISFAVTTQKTRDIVSPEFKGAGHRVIRLAPEYDENLGGELSHIVVMQHVTKERLQTFLDELAGCAAIRE